MRHYLNFDELQIGLRRAAMPEYQQAQDILCKTKVG